MAQASGISNSVRQLGGSLGVAILATLLTSRVNYHAQQYGHALNPGSEVFKETAKNIKFHIVHDAGATLSNASGISQRLIISNLNKQAYIQGISDDFLLASLITLIGGIPIIFMHTKKSKTEKNPINE
jgi:DHA2 family multidrug resistance protein